MADLTVALTRGYGRQPIMPPFPTLLINLVQGEVARGSDVVSRVLTPLLPSLLVGEALRVVANTASVIVGNTGQVAFNASPDQATLTGYTVQIRISGSSTVVATQSLGVPTPDGNNVIIVSCAATFAGLTAGNYTVSILATSAGGSTDSSESAPFALPLT